MGIDLGQVQMRLRILEKALGKKPAEIARETGIRPSEWSMFTNPGPYERLIKVETAWILWQLYDISLDWIYTGDESALSVKRAAEIRVAAKQLSSELSFN